MSGYSFEAGRYFDELHHILPVSGIFWLKNRKPRTVLFPEPVGPITLGVEIFVRKSMAGIGDSRETYPMTMSLEDISSSLSREGFLQPPRVVAVDSLLAVSCLFSLCFCKSH